MSNHSTGSFVLRDDITFDGVKVFAATLSREREMLGETVTSWMETARVDVTEMIVTQSSDSRFHCISITLFYRGRRG